MKCLSKPCCSQYTLTAIVSLKHKTSSRCLKCKYILKAQLKSWVYKTVKDSTAKSIQCRLVRSHWQNRYYQQHTFSKTSTAESFFGGFETCANSSDPEPTDSKHMTYATSDSRPDSAINETKTALATNNTITTVIHKAETLPALAVTCVRRHEDMTMKTDMSYVLMSWNSSIQVLGIPTCEVGLFPKHGSGQHFHQL